MSRATRDKVFRVFCRIASYFALLILAVLLIHVVKEGWQWLDAQFLSSFPSRHPEKAGVKAAIFGSLYLISLTALFAIPVGVGSALYLEEYAENNKFNRMIQVCIANLAGMPSIIYGLLGMLVFGRFFMLEDSLLTGALTLALMALPVITISSRNSIQSVPRALREAGYAVGARKYQVVFFQVLPAAIPGIMTGVILSISRAIGETAPLIVVGALSYIAFVPESLMDPFTVLPVQVYNWASRPQEEFHQLAAAGIITLLVVLFLLNSLAVFIRMRASRRR
jgi:phosphate transport system permease protein